MGVRKFLHYVLAMMTVLFYAIYVIHVSLARKEFYRLEPVAPEEMSSVRRNWSSLGYWRDLTGRIVSSYTKGFYTLEPAQAEKSSDRRNWSSLGYWTDLTGRIVSSNTISQAGSWKRSRVERTHFLHQKNPLDQNTDPPPAHEQLEVKRIMYWNTAKSKPPLDFRDCEYNSCAMTTNPKKADVLWLDTAAFKLQTLPWRAPNQIWLFGSRDPPDLPMFDHLDRSDLHNQVNWTWYLMSDSTWQARYGHLQEIPLPNKKYNEIFKTKRHDIAWFVSMCDRPSKRTEYARRMMSQVDVHVYGLCGNFTCGSSGYHMGHKREECLNMLSRDYKFYLAFENSFCKDYVTEKFFNVFNDVDTIPVVRGGFEYEKHLPPGTYIDAKDFRSPESLGAYLHELARDEEKYVSMLKRKNRFTLVPKPVRIDCQLCKAAHLRQPQHVYEDLYQWLRAPGNCWLPTDL